MEFGFFGSNLYHAAAAALKKTKNNKNPFSSFHKNDPKKPTTKRRKEKLLEGRASSYLRHLIVPCDFLLWIFSIKVFCDF
jgi:hypothetical protein